MNWIKIAEENSAELKKFKYKYWVPVIAKKEPDNNRFDDNQRDEEMEEYDIQDVPSSVLGVMADDFNEAELQQYFWRDKSLINKIISMKMDPAPVNDGVVITVTANTELNETELDTITEEINGQCADGWGEGFEQSPVDGFYISTWDSSDVAAREIHRIK